VTNGKQPYWPNSIHRVYLKPAAESIGLTKRFGWHTFRHTFGTILNANGEELLRQVTLKVTMDTYVQAVSDEKRNAQNKVVEMLSSRNAQGSELMDAFGRAAKSGVVISYSK
jgi:integrase